MKQNNYTDLNEIDFIPLIKYFSLKPNSSSNTQLSYQEFLGLILPCSNPMLRSHVIQLQQSSVRPPAYAASNLESQVSPQVHKYASF